MSHFLLNTACPKCRSNGSDVAGDNLGVYSDGHKICWKCGYWEPGDKVQEFSNKQKQIVNSKGLVYPDIVPFSKECLDYLQVPCELNKFQPAKLTNEEIYSNLNGHEDGYSFFDNKFFTVRRLHKQPKVISHGDIVGNEPVFRAAEISNTIVLVEDILSAIKVSRVIDSCALLKNQIHDILIYRLANLYDNCYLWLDPDMYEHMTKKLLPRVKPYFKECKVIMSEKDPKYLSTKEIRKYIYD